MTAVMNRATADGLPALSNPETGESLVLLPYQREGVEYLVANRLAYLADDPGLGKTVQAASAAAHFPEPLVVICPASARMVWKKIAPQWAPDTLIQAVSFDKVSRGGIQLPKRYTLVVDEAHYLKEVTSARSKAVLGSTGIARNAARIWMLSGTPMPNGAWELWPIFYTFGWTRISFSEWQKTYCHYNPMTQRYHGVRKEALPELKALVHSKILRRRKADVEIQLPPIRFSEMPVEAVPVDPFLLELYWYSGNAAKAREEVKLEQAQLKAIWPGDRWLDPHERELRDAMIDRLGNSVPSLRRYAALSKIPPVLEVVRQELTDNIYDKIVIFAHCRAAIEELRKGLADFGAVTLYGGTPDDKRAKNVESFQKNPRTRVFVGQVQAAGTAITLTAAAEVLMLEQDWVPATNAQAVMRCHRIGQTRPVQVRYAYAAGTIDESVAKVVARKTRDIVALDLG